ncbi:hypothetical protein Tco_0196728 [Tanacetum coccineum]
MIIEKQPVLEMHVDESLEMIVDKSFDMIVDESLDMIVDESLMVKDKSLVELMDETLKLDEKHFESIDSYGTTPIIDKIRKFEDLLTSGQAILVDKAGNPLKKVEFPGEYDSEDEVASVDNDTACSMASKRVGFGTQSLLEQWRDSYGNGDYDDDPYDDDMYEGQDLSHELQAICDNLDIRVRGRKKK